VIHCTGIIQTFGCTFDSNNCGLIGGSVRLNRGHLLVETSVLNNNNAGSNGAALYVSDTSTTSTTPTTLTWCNLTSNVATNGDGTLHIVSGSLSVKDCGFVTNEATTGHGSAISMVDGTLSVSGSLFDTNMACYLGCVMYSVQCTRGTYTTCT